MEFLHPHQNFGPYLSLQEDHVLIDRKDWEKAKAQAEEIKDLRFLAGKLAVAFHMGNHASMLPSHPFSECQEPFCQQARKLGLTSPYAAKSTEPQ